MLAAWRKKKVIKRKTTNIEALCYLLYDYIIYNILLFILLKNIQLTEWN